MVCIGLIAETVGLVYAFQAIQKQNRAHEGGPIWTWPYRVGKWIQRHILRQHRPPVAGTAHVVIPASTIHATATVHAPTIVTDMSLEEQVRLLTNRIERVEQQAVNDHRAHKESIDTVRREATEIRTEFKAATETVRAKLTDLAVGNVGLEATALLWIAGGAILTAGSSVIQSWPW